MQPSEKRNQSFGIFRKESAFLAAQGDDKQLALF